MNNIKFTGKALLLTLCFVALIAFSGCSGFLNEVSQDNIIPKDVKELSDLLYGESYATAYNEQAYSFDYIELMTDDVKSVVKAQLDPENNNVATGFGYYTWQADPEIKAQGSRVPDRSWFNCYHAILIANVVLSQIDDVEGTPQDKARLRGECHAIRAYNHFMLANTYADVYDPKVNPDSPGIPNNEVNIVEDKSMPRNTLKENYDMIFDDIAKGLDAFSKADGDLPSIFRWNAPALHLLASRAYLYIKDYDKAIEHASQVLVRHAAIYDLRNKVAKDPDNNLPMINKDNPEILFTYGSGPSRYFESSNSGYFYFSDDLVRLYYATPGDLRLNDKGGVYMKSTGGGWFSPKVNRIYKNDIVSTSNVFGKALRTAEAYLNRAEAYAEKGQTASALKDLEMIRRMRYAADSYKPLELTTQDEVRRAVREERRKELSFEQHRWYDLRRWGKPEIEHVYTPTDKEKHRYVLSKDDNAYILPPPETIILAEPDLYVYPRDKREPVEKVTEE